MVWLFMTFNVVISVVSLCRSQGPMNARHSDVQYRLLLLNRNEFWAHFSTLILSTQSSDCGNSLFGASISLIFCTNDLKLDLAASFNDRSKNRSQELPVGFSLAASSSRLGPKI